MHSQLPDPGTKKHELAGAVQAYWQEAAKKAGINLAGLDPNAPEEERISWALDKGLRIGTIYTRYSSRRQCGLRDQARLCAEWAAAQGTYCP